MVESSERDEYVEIINAGDAPQELSGWKLKELRGQDDKIRAIFEFPSWALGPGEVIRVYTNEIHPEWGGFSFERGVAIWNNDVVDTAQLFDENDQLIDSESYNLDDKEGVCSVVS